MTLEQVDQMRAAAGAARAVVQVDSANLTTAKFNLDNTTVRAPISGRTGGLLVRPGNLARANGVAPLVVINQVRPIVVRFSVPGSPLPLILRYGKDGGLPVRAGPSAASAPPMTPMPTPAPVDAPPQTAAIPMQLAGAADSADGGVEGTLYFIDNAVDTATGTVQLKATFDNSTGRLWAGQFATTSLHLYDQENALVVPQQAIVTGQRGSYVYVVDQADTARQRAVIVERTAGGLAIIASGIHDGDRVVTEGQSRLTPDAPVRLRGAGRGERARR